MNDPIPQDTPVQEHAHPVPPQSSPARRLGDLLAQANLTQLTLLVLAGLVVWLWLDEHAQLNQTQQEVARRLSEVEAANKASQILVAQNQELVRELGGKLSVLESSFAETQSQRAALDTLYQEMSSSRDQTALAEVEQMLLIAGEQLQFSANVPAALIALQQAQSRLQRPAMAGLKQRIAQDIEKLRALPSIDVPGINQRLDGVIAVVDTLALVQDAHAQPQKEAVSAVPAGSQWQRFWSGLWQEVRSLVRVENMGQQSAPLLSPTQAYFLRENLKLRLQSARMALLMRDEVSYRRDLKTAQEWLRRYFEVKSGDGAQAQATLQKLAASSIVIVLPDLSGSLEAVRSYRVTHERSPQ